ncbi:MAG: class I SAM-dependent methyltransferase, partial [Candidatus Eremiobacteraeota bacterium]|nr:class I SAM-dependent methyltransferase [Candidatus Eremiobacteraeota bacterium]
SIDRSAEKQAMARANLERANVLDRVTLRCGDATELIRSLAGTFDAVLFDADRVTATEQLELLLPRLSGDALVLTDNVLSHPAEVAAYLADVQRRPEFISVVIPVGKGLHVAYRLRG